MLVLSRKSGETIQIGDDITITVVELPGRRVKLGIEAPLRYRVLRGEIVGWSDDDRCAQAAAELALTN